MNIHGRGDEKINFYFNYYNEESPKKFCIMLAYLKDKISTHFLKMKINIHSKYFQLLRVNPCSRRQILMKIFCPLIIQES